MSELQNKVARIICCANGNCLSDLNGSHSVLCAPEEDQKLAATIIETVAHDQAATIATLTAEIDRLRKSRNDVIEECAKVADRTQGLAYGLAEAGTAKEIASTIRAMKEPT